MDARRLGPEGLETALQVLHDDGILPLGFGAPV